MCALETALGYGDGGTRDRKMNYARHCKYYSKILIKVVNDKLETRKDALSDQLPVFEEVLDDDETISYFGSPESGRNCRSGPEHKK